MRLYPSASLGGSEQEGGDVLGQGRHCLMSDTPAQHYRTHLMTSSLMTSAISSGMSWMRL